MSAGSAFYCYDANGNMTQKIDGSTTSYTYDAENRMTAVSGAATATFVYDGDGNRVKGVVSGVTTTYIGNYFEWSGSTGTMKKYYYAGGTRVAERVGSSSLYWLLSDHLGSTSITATSSGSIVGELRYKPWGETRYTYGSTPTTIRYTGQREESSLGLYWYASRWYSPGLGRFVSPDSIVPDPYNSLDYDHYSYTRNNPVKYSDPSGHAVACMNDDLSTGCAGTGLGGLTPSQILDTNLPSIVQDRAIYNYSLAHPTYNYTLDPELEDTGKYLVANAIFIGNADHLYRQPNFLDRIRSSWTAFASGFGLAMAGIIVGGDSEKPEIAIYNGMKLNVDDALDVATNFLGEGYNSSYLNRFLSPDSIIPAPYDPQFWDRYSYVRNNPANRVDPDGHAEKDPDGGCGLKSCIYSFQQDLLASKIFKGSNDDGSWNWKDRYFFSNNRDAIWRDPSKWLNSDPEGWEGFVVRVERLSSHYTEKEKNKFLRDFSLVWGGIPNDTNFITAGLSVGHGPHEIQPLNESNTGLRSDLLDINGATDNQSHHYVGLFFLGYYISPDIARAISYVRDHDNLGDIALGEMAIQDGHNFHRNGTYDDLVSQIRDLLGQ